MTETLIRLAMPVAAVAVTALAVRMLWRRVPGAARPAILLLAAFGTLHGAFKSIRQVATADEGVELVRAEVGVTNGLAMVVAAATNGIPAPAWYRRTETNDWTQLSAGSGWTAQTNALDGGAVEVAWTNPDTNAVPESAKMWHFGGNPPPVHVVVEGGVTLLAAAFDSRRVTLRYAVDMAVDISGQGVRVSVQCSANGRDWTEAAAVDEVTHLPTTVVVAGFVLDRTSYWRIRLEVPR